MQARRRGVVLVLQRAQQSLRPCSLSCLVDPSDLSGLVDNQAISGSSLKFFIDNARMTVGGWACEANCE
jgi:hypothetical protein